MSGACRSSKITLTIPAKMRARIHPTPAPQRSRTSPVRSPKNHWTGAALQAEAFSWFLLVIRRHQLCSEDDINSTQASLSRSTNQLRRLHEQKRSEPFPKWQSLLTCSRLLQQMIPAEDLDDAARPKDRRSRKYVERPGFSIPTMSYNFRRFNARCVLRLLHRTCVII